MSLHVSKCHIVGNHMSRLKCCIDTIFIPPDKTMLLEHYFFSYFKIKTYVVSTQKNRLNKKYCKIYD